MTVLSTLEPFLTSIHEVECSDEFVERGLLDCELKPDLLKCEECISFDKALNPPENDHKDESICAKLCILNAENQSTDENIAASRHPSSTDIPDLRKESEDGTPPIQNFITVSPVNECSVHSTDIHDCAKAPSATKSSISRNKPWSSTLTEYEEDRIVEILDQEDDAIESYILQTGEEKIRDVELDDLLSKMGYIFDKDQITAQISTRGDPVLRELVKQRSLKEREKDINLALRALLREPLPRAIKPLKTTDDTSLLSSIDDTALSAHINEKIIKELVEKVRQNLEDDNITLADPDSVRLLATAILNDEFAKCSTSSKRDVGNK